MNEKGMIFDIQRCSMYDGPGIRTTLFLKGCPLRCKWCHNPESQSVKPQIMFFHEQCTYCGACAVACKKGNHQVGAHGHFVMHENCNACGDCVKACLQGALQQKGEVWDTKSLLDLIEKDRVYYERSGGGITLSGGDPTLQLDFTLSIVQGAKEKGIHTCIETCGQAPKEHFERLLPFVDLFLFDYKVTQPIKHKELTGVSNILILDNLDALYHQGAKIILRCPMIPGINDDTEHLAEIAALCLKYPALQGIEIMPYHAAGTAKYPRVGKEPYYPDLQNATEEIKAVWLQKLHYFGCDKAILG